jgi:hypothetical protein
MCTLLHRACCCNDFFNIPTRAHTIYALNTTKIHIRVHDKVSLSKEHQTHTQTDCDDIRPQTAQFYNERIPTDLNLVTWQNTVHEPPEDGLKVGPKHVEASF